MKRLLFFTLLFHTLLFAENTIEKSFSYIQLPKQDNNLTKIIQKSEAGLFSILNEKHSKFGFTDDIFWIKVYIKNHTNFLQKQILELNHPALDYIDIYLYKDKRLILKKELGDLRVYDKSSFMPNPTYAFTLLPFEEKQFYIQIKSTGSMNIGISVKNIKDYILFSITQIKWLSFYFGAVLIMLMYNFILYLIIKNRSFLYYVLFHLSYLVFALSLSGISFELFWPQIPKLNQYVLPISMPLTGAFALLFSIHFLNIKNFNTKLSTILYFFAILSFIVAFSIFFLGYSIVIQIGSLITFLSVLFLFIVSFYLAFIKKDVNSVFYLIAWSFFLSGVAISHLSNIGIIPSILLTNYASQIGSFFEVLLLSIGLAYYYNRLRKKHIELTYNNTLLRELSHTDMLTKSFNRRYFYGQAKLHLEKSKQNNDKISLLMLDLDFFKKINDNFGHDIGDKVLIDFTNICKNSIRENDIFARFGGEEFVIFLPNTNQKQAYYVAQKIQTTLKNHTFSYLPNLSLTVSIGISSNHFDLETLLKQADLALYEAKHSGRNTIIIHNVHSNF